MNHRKAPRDHAYDKLLTGYYGGKRRDPRHPASDRWLPRNADELLTGYYGKPEHGAHHATRQRWLPHSAIELLGEYGKPKEPHHPHRDRTRRLSVESSVDDGETLRSDPRAGEFEDYVVMQALTENSNDEYVVDRVPMGADLATSTSISESAPDPEREWQVDVLDPLGAPQPQNRLVDAAPMASPPAAQPPPLASDAVSSAQASLGRMAPASGGPSDDDFIADMQSILTGQSVYDPVAGKTRSKKDVATQTSTSAAPVGPADAGTGSSQAIFDKIAANMKYANAYDLGTVELENRFTDFDHQWEQQQKAETAKRQDRSRGQARSSAPASPAVATTEEFIDDIDTLRREAIERAGATPAATVAGAPEQTAGPAMTDPGTATLWGDASAAGSMALALDAGPAGSLNAPFVNQALKTTFATAADINGYFAQHGAADFISWFNANAANHGSWAKRAIGTRPAVASNFQAIWDRIPQIFGSANINLLQFLSLMSILINEVGADLAPISERIGTKDHPGLAYAFDRISGKKRSYNVDGSNWTAHKCFNDADFVAAHGQKALGAQFQNTTDQRWRGYVYPAGVPTDVDPAVTGFVMEADFYKFRGRGLIQTTWRDAYKALIGFIQSYSGTQAAVLDRTRRWSGMTADKIASVSSNSDWDDLFMRSDLEIPCVAIAQHNRGGNYLSLSTDPHVLNGREEHGSIWRVARTISGGDAYADLMRNRVIALCNLLGN